MSKGIRFSLIEKDDDYLMICVAVQDELTTLSDSIFINNDGIENLISTLKKFRLYQDSDNFSFALGRFEKGYAGGAVKVCLLFDSMRKIIIDVHIRRNSHDSDGQVEVSEARFHLKSDSSKLDQFIHGLETIDSGDDTEAFFEVF